MAKVHKRTWMTKTLGERVAWVADYFAPGPDGKRKRHTKSFRTKKEATAWLANTVVEIRLGTHTPAHKSPTVLEAGKAWIAQAETDGLERSTIVAYRQLLDLRLGAALRRFHLFAYALSATIAMAAPARADDDKALRFVPHADLTIIDPYFSGVYTASRSSWTQPGDLWLLGAKE
jgi:hypothetical protein